MYKRLALLVLSITLIGTLSGCIKNDYKVQVNEDGTTDATISVLISESFMKQIGMTPNAMLEQAVESNPNGLEIKTLSEETSDGIYSGVQYIAHCETSEELLATLNNATGASSILNESMNEKSSAPAELMIEDFTVTVENQWIETAYTTHIKVLPIWSKPSTESKDSQFYDIETIVKSNLVVSVPGKLTTTSEYIQNGEFNVNLVTLKEPLDITLTSVALNMKVVENMALLLLFLLAISMFVYTEALRVRKCKERPKLLVASQEPTPDDSKE